jgi:hypothetical protein
MKALASLAFLLALTATGCRASEHDFSSVVAGVEQRYQVHAQRVPMMGMVSFVAHVATHGGVKGMRIANFENLNSATHGEFDREDLFQFVQSRLDAGWQPFVTERSNHGGEQTVIFVRPSGQSMRMLIANYENGELNLVRMEMNGDRLSHWMKDPDSHARRAAHGDVSDDGQDSSGREE